MQPNSLSLTRRRLFSALLLLSLSASGCGSGGNNEQGAVPLATTTRLLQPGDTWTYNVAFATDRSDISQIERVESRSADGTLHYHIESLEGITQRVVEQQLSQLDSARPVSLEREDRSTVFGGRTESTLAITYPSRYSVLFGTWQKEATIDHDAFASPHTNITGTIIDGITNPSAVPARKYRIVGSEMVSTPAGRFTTWKVVYNGTASIARGEYQSTVWYAPQLGNFVKWKAQILNTQTSELEDLYEITLTKTTVRTP